MGQDLTCPVDLYGERANARVLLETSELVVRGAVRAKIPFSTIRRVEARDGCLEIATPAGIATFAIGSAAPRWADRIQNPPTLLDKLGVQPGIRVALVGDFDDSFVATLRERAVDLAPASPRGAEALILYGIDEPIELERLTDLRHQIVANGGIWVVHRRGGAVRDLDVIDAGKRHGLVDVKVARFSDTHTASKLVIPKARRG